MASPEALQIGRIVWAEVADQNGIRILERGINQAKFANPTELASVVIRLLHYERFHLNCRVT